MNKILEDRFSSKLSLAFIFFYQIILSFATCFELISELFITTNRHSINSTIKYQIHFFWERVTRKLLFWEIKKQITKFKKEDNLTLFNFGLINEKKTWLLRSTASSIAFSSISPAMNWVALHFITLYHFSLNSRNTIYFSVSPFNGSAQSVPCLVSYNNFLTLKMERIKETIDFIFEELSFRKRHFEETPDASEKIANIVLIINSAHALTFAKINEVAKTKSLSFKLSEILKHGKEFGISVIASCQKSNDEFVNQYFEQQVDLLNSTPVSSAIYGKSQEFNKNQTTILIPDFTFKMSQEITIQNYTPFNPLNQLLTLTCKKGGIDSAVKSTNLRALLNLNPNETIQKLYHLYHYS
jgi:hypothetical protein